MVAGWFVYRDWKSTYSLTPITAALFDGQLKTDVDNGVFLVSLAEYSDTPVQLHVGWGFENHNGSSEQRRHVISLLACHAKWGIDFRRAENTIDSQGIVEARQFCTRFFWSSETVADGAIIYLSVNLYKDGELIDTSSTQIRVGIKMEDAE